MLPIVIVVSAIVLLTITFIILLIKFSLPKRVKLDLRGKHAFITGGSKGIGKAIALELINRGASVTIVARDSTTLMAACAELQTICDARQTEQRAQSYTLDVTESANRTESVIRQAEIALGPVDVLVNNAGHSVQDAFDRLPIDAFDEQMRINYLSAVYATRAVVGAMKQRRAGTIAFVSSAAGQLGIWGYSAYSAAKFALRGFAESLQMEMEPYDVVVHVLYPPNTNTEGFQEELRTMPEEVRLISETAGCFESKQVARRFIDDMVTGAFGTSIGIDGWMLGIESAGGAPETHLCRALQQVFLAGIFRAILLVYHRHFRKVVAECARKRANTTGNDAHLNSD